MRRALWATPPVTATGTLLAVIAAVLDDPRFANIRLSLTLPDQAVDASVGSSNVIGTGNLPGRYTVSGV